MRVQVSNIWTCRLSGKIKTDLTPGCVFEVVVDLGSLYIYIYIYKYIYIIHIYICVCSVCSLSMRRQSGYLSGH